MPVGSGESRTRGRSAKSELTVQDPPTKLLAVDAGIHAQASHDFAARAVVYVEIVVASEAADGGEATRETLEPGRTSALDHPVTSAEQGEPGMSVKRCPPRIGCDRREIDQTVEGLVQLDPGLEILLQPGLGHPRWRERGMVEDSSPPPEQLLDVAFTRLADQGNDTESVHALEAVVQLPVVGGE